MFAIEPIDDDQALTNDVVAKLKLVGKDLNEYSRETVQMFYRDAVAAAYSIDTGTAPARVGTMR